ncbi:hypothetical protein [Microbacterium sp. p3-SID336]|uniref:hypothetical protein n=1 Tax=Microbacterium sp. p3-SID336 TaxID=2916212 RepID=UPI0021A48630|nr:hypothetical protein [Microbacterium sp. p3-SID336]MCT1479855.1 hypothetical protein [Microbacterium sp. p3-SID336]
MAADNFIVLGLGVVLLVLGPLVVRNRQRLFDITADANRALGGAAGREVAKRGSAAWVGACGIAMIVFGLIAILMGLFVRG